MYLHFSNKKGPSPRVVFSRGLLITHVAPSHSARILVGMEMLIFWRVSPWNWQENVAIAQQLWKGIKHNCSSRVGCRTCASETSLKMKWTKTDTFFFWSVPQKNYPVLKQRSKTKIPLQEDPSFYISHPACSHHLLLSKHIYEVIQGWPQLKKHKITPFIVIKVSKIHKT